MKTLNALNRFLSLLEKSCIVLFLGLMIFFTFLDVLLRNLYIHAHFNWANQLMGRLDWSSSMVRLLVLWLSFLGASLITAENKHIKIDLAPELLPSRLQPWREIILSVACMALTGFMAYTAWGYIGLERRAGDVLFLALPAWIGHFILTLGFGLILFKFSLRCLEQALLLIKGK